MDEEELFRLMDEEMAKRFPALYGAYVKEEEVKPDVTTPKGILDMRKALIKLHKKA